MLSRRWVPVVLLGACLAWPLAAWAQQNRPPPPPPAAPSMPTPSVRLMRGAPNRTGVDVPPFAKLDANKDEQLSRGEIPKDVEALKTLRAHFQEADRDHNGRLSPGEYNRYLASRALSAEGS